VVGGEIAHGDEGCITAREASHQRAIASFSCVCHGGEISRHVEPSLVVLHLRRAGEGVEDVSVRMGGGLIVGCADGPEGGEEVLGDHLARVLLGVAVLSGGVEPGGVDFSFLNYA